MTHIEAVAARLFRLAQLCGWTNDELRAEAHATNAGRGWSWEQDYVDGSLHGTLRFSQQRLSEDELLLAVAQALEWMR